MRRIKRTFGMILTIFGIAIDSSIDLCCGCFGVGGG